MAGTGGASKKRLTSLLQEWWEEAPCLFQEPGRVSAMCLKAQRGARDIAQLVEHLPTTHRALGLITRIALTGPGSTCL